ncbi:ribosome maturation factor RimP [Nocardioides sp. TRM66260-LWL]|nr:ribosome maturation factor RimP [Nocardioides sp. TRM66260-LWL]MBZ5734368.1 ribosome maturation factor RimP [Nocardioides sp. TRM66260-LWL]
MTDRIGDAVRASLLEAGFDLEAVELTPAGKRRVLRIAVDRDGGITLDDVAEATRAISAVLDDSDVLGQQPYTLEVTSRGVDRPLTLPRHWRRNVGRLVKVTPLEGAAFSGRIVEAGEGSVVVEVRGARRTVALADVGKALVQIEFNRPGPVDDPEDAGATDDIDENEGDS